MTDIAGAIMWVSFIAFMGFMYWCDKKYDGL